MVDILVKPAADADLANAVVIEDATLPHEDVDAAALGLPYDTPLEFRVLGTPVTKTIATPAAAAYTTTVDDLPEDYLVLPADLANGGTVADAPLSGHSDDAPEGTAIMARVINDTTDAEVHPEVQIATVDENGDWVGAYPDVAMNLAHGTDYLTAKVRVAGSTAETRLAQCFHVGLLWVTEKQSMIHQTLQPTGVTGVARDTIGNNGNNFQMIWNGNDGSTTQPRIFVNDARVALETDPVHLSAAAMAAFFHAVAPGLKVKAGFITKSGSAATRPLNDNDSQSYDRPWSCVTGVADALHTSLNLPISIWDFHHSQGLSDGFRSLCAVMWGTDETGTPIPEIDTASEFAPYGEDEGLFAEDIIHIWAHAFPELLTGRAKLAEISTNVMRHYDEGDDKEAIDAVRYGTPRLEPIHAVHGDKILQIPGGLANFLTGERKTPDDGTLGTHHMPDDSYWGAGMVLRARAFLTLQGLGFFNPARGYFDTFEFTPTRILVSCSNGFNITSRALQEGITAKYPDDPLTDAVTPGTRRIVGFLFENGDWAMNTEIVDENGDPATSGPYVAIYPNAGQTFDFATRVYFQHIIPTRLETDMAFQDAGVQDYLPIFDDPHGVLYGWPVESQSAASVAAMIAANTMTDPDAGIIFTEIDGGEPRPTQTVQPQDPDVFTFEAYVRRDTGSSMALLGYGTTANQFGIIAIGSTGYVVFRLEGYDGDPMYAIDDQQTTGADQQTDEGVFPENTFRRVRIAGNLTELHCWVEDEEGVMQLADGAADGEHFGTLAQLNGLQTGTNNRLLQAISNQPGGSKGDFAWFKYWAEYLEPGDTPSAAPAYDIYSDGAGGFQTTEPTQLTSVTHEGVTFDLSNVTASGTTEDGVPWVVGTNLTLESITPDLQTNGTDFWSGAQINQTHISNSGTQQFHSDIMMDGTPASIAGSALAAGDIVVGTDGRDPTVGGFDRRHGIANGWGGLIVLDAVPSGANELFAPPLIKWSGSATPALIDIDLDALVAARPRLSATGIDAPTAAEVLACIDKFALGYGLTMNRAGGGYEAVMPDGYTGDTLSNYGSSTCATTGAAALAACLGSTSDADARQILLRLISLGIQSYDPLTPRAPMMLDPNGGHHGWELFAVALALHAQGRTSDLASLPTELVSNPWGMCFTVPADFPTWMDFHDGLTGSDVVQMGRRRNVVSVDGDIVFIEANASLDPNRLIINGQYLHRESDDALAEVDVVENSVSGASGSNLTVVSNALSEWGAYRVVMQPGHGLVAGDVVKIDPSYTINVGDPEWAIGWALKKNSYVPGPDTSYREQAVWADQLLAIQAWGLGVDVSTPWAYVASAMTGGPTGANWPKPVSLFNSQDFAETFWNAHASSLAP